MCGLFLCGPASREQLPVFCWRGGCERQFQFMSPCKRRDNSLRYVSFSYSRQLLHESRAEYRIRYAHKTQFLFRHLGGKKGAASLYSACRYARWPIGPTVHPESPKNYCQPSRKCRDRLLGQSSSGENSVVQFPRHLIPTSPDPGCLYKQAAQSFLPYGC